MKVFVTGISCSGWKEHVAAAIQGTDIPLLDIGDTIFDISREQNLGFSDNQILNAPSSALQPDVFVNILDDLPKLKEGMDRNSKWRDQQISVDEVLIWREEESFVTKFLADLHRKPFYILLRGDDPLQLQDMILKPLKPKAYLSFSITNIQEPEELDNVRRFRDILREFLVLFDPLAMKENEVRKWTDTQLPGLTERTKDRISTQTVDRDYQLIQQSDMVIVYMPENRFSAGVVNEIRSANEMGKKVYVIWPFPESPFLSYYIDRIFHSPDEALVFLEDRYRP